MYYKLVLLDAVQDYDRPYIYKSKEELRRGQLVYVPFGPGNKPREGLVLGSAEAFSGAKELISSSQIFLEEEALAAAEYLSCYYVVSLASYLRLFLPRALRVEPRRFLVPREGLSPEELDDYLFYKEDEKILLEKNLVSPEYVFFPRVKLPVRELLKPNCSREDLEEVFAGLALRSHRQREVLERLIYVYPSPLERSDESLDAIRALEGRGLLERLFLPRRISSAYSDVRTSEMDFSPLSDEEERVFRGLASDRKNPRLLIRENASALNIYLQLARRAMEEKKKFILLYPDASMIPGVVEVFKSHFGDRVGVYHGKMTPREIKSELLYYKEGRFPIMITSRLGLFLKPEAGDYMVMEHSQDDGYISQNPYYQGVELALYYARQVGVKLVLSSPIPDLEVYLREDLDRYHLKNKLELDMELIDMRREMVEGNSSPLSRKMVEEIGKLLEKGGLGMLLMNKRHFASYIFCRSCGKALNCPQCSSSLYYNQRDKKLFCPNCNYRAPYQDQCPSCGSTAFKYYGGGIEMIYSELKKIFPRARIITVDAKTMEAKDGYIKLHRLLKARKVDLVLGTGLISRGINYDIDFLGVINADFYLHLPSYRAAQKGYQMLRLFLERGRPGARALIQSYEPKNYVLQSVIGDRGLEFLKQEARLREARVLPPFNNYLLIRIFGKAQELEENCTKIISQINQATVEISKPFGYWLKEERRILIKGQELEPVKEQLRSLLGQGIRFSVVVDPINSV